MLIIFIRGKWSDDMKMIMKQKSAVEIYRLILISANVNRVYLNDITL